MIIIVEGNIGAGKTSFCQDLCKFLSSFCPVYMEEPIDQWTCLNGENLLKLFYEDKNRWALTFQINALVSTTGNALDAIQCSKDGNVVVMERSSFSVLEIFSELMSEEVFQPVERAVMNNMKKLIPHHLKDYDKVLTIYLKTPPEVCYNRVLKRARLEEVDKIDKYYLNKLHDLHEEKIHPDKVYGSLLVVDGMTYKKGDLSLLKMQGKNYEESFVNILIKYLNM